MNDSSNRANGSNSSAFELLHEHVQNWIYKQGWDDLREPQEQAIRSILGSHSDILIAAPTAAGKTEAAFLPICSKLVEESGTSIRALYVSPLKALINDQYDRLQDLMSVGEVPVTPWHGDISGGKKSALIKTPRGVLLITPESLEALFVLRGHQVMKMFAQLDWLVLDEIHSYIGTARGRQVQSLANRLEAVIGRRVVRIGLSATIGDLGLSAEYLRPGDGESVRLIESKSMGQEIRLQVRGYTRKLPASGLRRSASRADDTGNDTEDISRHIYEHLRGSNNLVFANSRRKVEIFADFLRRLCESNKVPNEFVPHHGNLSRELREFAEARLKQHVLPTTALCTSTLELGIDIGQVTSIGQIGAPFSVASMRQRLGRSGRRGDPAVLRMYISEFELSSLSTTVDSLRPELVQAIAMVELLSERWCEPPVEGRLHLSTLIHQVLALIAERGGVSATTAWNMLCDSGVFRTIDKPVFSMLLRAMGDHDLVSQMDDGTLIHGLKGERIVNHYTFYAVFETPDEFRMIHDGHVLGTMSLDQSVAEGNYIIFGGKRWKVLAVDQHEKRIDVVPGPGGKPPLFDPNRGGMVHDEVRKRMRLVYEGVETPAYIDSTARALLCEARQSYTQLDLARTRIIKDGRDTLFFACRGDRIMNTLIVMLIDRGISASLAGPALTAHERTPEDVIRALEEIREDRHLDAGHLAMIVGNKRVEKYDWVLSEELLDLEYASSSLDLQGARSAIDDLLGSQ